MEKDEIIIRSAIMHILDSTVGMPVLSDELLPLTPDMNDFLRNHIYKVISGDELKTCVFDEEKSEVYRLIQDFTEENMVETTKKLAELLYSIMNSNVAIPPADVFFVTYQMESEHHLAILKMNYKEVYMHYTSMNEEDGNVNDVMKQCCALPGGGGRLSEAVTISLAENTVQLIEKKAEINGAKVNYLSEIYLQCHAKMSQKTKLDIVTKAVDQINKKYFEDDFEKKMEAKSVIHNTYAEQGALVPEEIGEELFGEIPEIKEEFVEKLEKYKLPKEEITVKSEKTTKKFEKQFLTTDSGIEINIPMEEYNNKQHVEFITNPDGTISVLIKNISKITSK
ncbi:MAG: nucleoid-associated protein [Lachnospiraceae bacterium]|nr:nucleoid-associated protein [Lachnospiraceae bacterium]